MHLLTLMHKPCFSAQDTRDLLQALGSVSAGRYKLAFKNLLDIRLEEEPFEKGDGRRTRQMYYLRFKPQHDEDSELIGTFVYHVGRVLDLWLTDALVDARWEVVDEATGNILGQRL